MIDKTARKILFCKYWDPSKGWIRKELTKEDYNYAVKAGYMFDDIISSHDETVENCIEAIQKISKEKVVKAFVSSLTSRRLDLRSALASFACGEKLYFHSHTVTKKACESCGEYNSETEIDLNILNFERHKFGGVRHLQPTYINLDLNILSKEEVKDLCCFSGNRTNKLFPLDENCSVL